MKMELYISGILYARTVFDSDPLLVEMLNPFLGQLQPAQPLNPDLAAELSGLSRMDFTRIGRIFQEAQSFIDNGCESFTLSDGSLYERKDEDHYIQRHIKFPFDLILKENRIVGAQTSNRDSVAVLIDPVCKALTILSQWDQAYPDAPYAIEEKKELNILMRDAVCLKADLWLPKNIIEPLCCILVRTPYGRQEAAPACYRFVQRGYAVVIQDVRGRNDSEGAWNPMIHETEDGSDTLDWLAAQEWCNGRIGMIGGSYLGYVQWAAAASGNPHLKAIVSEVTSGSPFLDIPRRGGTLTSGTLAWAFAVSQKQMNAGLMVRNDWDQVLAHRPLAEVCEKALGYRVPFWEQWLAHPCSDDYWKQADWYTRSVERGGVSVPALIMSGWFDDNGMGSTQALDLTRSYEAGQRKVILGPWMHSGNANYDLHGVEMGSNAIRYDLDLCFFKWFECHLRQVHNGYDQTACVEYFTVGENRWKEAAAWPPEYTSEVSFYLGGSNARSSLGDGRLLPVCPQEQGRDTLVYDPAHPATHIIDMSENELEVPEDYTQEERRADYLCYTTLPLTEDMTVTGDAQIELFFSSDVPDTDLIVRLTRVDESGRSVKLSDGLFDLKYRCGFDREAFLEPGQIYPVTIRTTKISALFKAGQRLRLTVTSSAVNFSFPNSNTREGFAGTETAIAHNTLLYGAECPARIVLHCEVS